MVLGYQQRLPPDWNQPNTSTKRGCGQHHIGVLLRLGVGDTVLVHNGVVKRIDDYCRHTDVHQSVHRGGVAVIVDGRIKAKERRREVCVKVNNVLDKLAVLIVKKRILLKCLVMVLEQPQQVLTHSGTVNVSAHEG